MSPSKNAVGRHPVLRFGRAIAPSDRQHLASRRSQKESGTRANTVGPNDGCGAKYILGSMSKHWKYGQSRSQVVASGMRPFYLACSSNSAAVKRYSFLQIRSPLQSRKPHILALWKDALQGAQSALLQSLNRRDVPNAGLGFHLLDRYSILD